MGARHLGTLEGGGNVSDGLQATLHRLMQSGADTNPALNTLLDDYMRYHVVFLVAGGLFVLALAAFGVACWKRFRTTPGSGRRLWSFEKATYFCFGVSSVAVGLLLALVVVANLSNVLDPRHGFAGAIGLLGTPRVGSPKYELHQAFDTWLQSGSSQMPAVVQNRIDDRVSWQQPKSIICSVLLLGFVLLSARIWRRLIEGSRTRGAPWTVKRVALLAAGAASVTMCFLLMLMVLGNTQGSLAPVSLTLFYG